MSSVLESRALQLLQQLTNNPQAQFHAGQFEAIEALVEHRRRALVVQRTGWGKSAVYFLSALLMRERGAGPTLIVSPLLALMRDQVQAASRAGVRAAMINSANVTDWEAISGQLGRGELDVLLISPERLNNPDFLGAWMPRLLPQLGMLVVDEAHCISDWGHDFRPDYRRIRTLIEGLPAGVPVLATTATANKRVVQDVAEQLGVGPSGSLEQVFQLRGPLTRDSLRLGVLCLPGAAERLAWLMTYLKDLPSSGIIYTLTVSAAEDTARALRQAGFEVQAYTGKTDPDERQRLEVALKQNRVKALVATSALGMGFDKPDLGFVVHFGAPSSAVAYYQQVGRAGRGAVNADVLLLPGAEDREIWEYFASASMPSREKAEAVLRALAEARTAGQELTVPALESRADVKRSSLDLLLKVLAVEGAVERVGRGWTVTGRPWAYDAQRYQRVAQARLLEQEAMLAYLDTDQCRMQFLAYQLDDASAQPCGRCDVCARPWYPTEISGEMLDAARSAVQSEGLEIEPRLVWASGLEQLGIFENGRPLKGRIPEYQRCAQGRALARLTDLGWGNRLREIFAQAESRPELDQPLDADMGRACVRVLAAWEWEERPTVLVSLPSPVRPILVRSLAQGLAQIGRLTYVGEMGQPQVPGHFGGNSVFRCAATVHSFDLSPELAQYLAEQEPVVLLVTDVVDSRWSLTAAGRVLRDAGARAVLPFALASTH